MGSSGEIRRAQGSHATFGPTDVVDQRVAVQRSSVRMMGSILIEAEILRSQASRSEILAVLPFLVIGHSVHSWWGQTKIN